ncbi:MAG: LysR family transcriptional regulator [Clostridiales bacterium]|nr:LysR family transcriptional regulator [Clostridiales bacterium]
MELLQLKYFLEVAKYQNISVAARKNMIPQSGMSKTISKLEKELGYSLFDRTSNRIFLNERGKTFKKYVEKALCSLEDAKKSISLTDSLSGEVKVLVLENRSHVTGYINEFLMKYPEVRFYICHNLFGESDSEVDLCISATAPRWHDEKGITLIKEGIGIAVSKNHRLAELGQVNAKDITGEKFIFLPPNNSVNNIATAYCVRHGFSPDIAVMCDDPYYIRKFISLGVGIAFVPLVSWQGLYDDNTAILSVSDGEGLCRETAVFYHSDRFMPPAVERFRDFIIDKFKALQT